jgi:flavin-dependent dehydrogenase
VKVSQTDIVIIGAGPAGSVAAAMLVNRGYKVEVVERQHFPRFSIGESLLPQCMEFLAEAGLAEAVDAHGFQFKDGAAFQQDDEYSAIYFPEKTTPGRATTYQVMRADFDNILAQEAAKKGANFTFGEEVIAFESDANGAAVTVRDEQGGQRRIEARFALDASGFGRTLSRLLNLEEPSKFPQRRAVYGQVRDNIPEGAFDRKKILVSVNSNNPEIWYWLIPLADGISSIGAVGPQEAIEQAGADDHARLFSLIDAAPHKAALLKNATIHRPINTIIGYACSVRSLVGPRYALLGNAAECLDPVFSSGVTIAMKSATLASKLIDRELKGEQADWQKDFVEELYVGIETFRACVAAWYDGSLQRIIFNRPAAVNEATRMLTAVLAGYAWDRSNSIVREPARFLRLLDELCAQN